MKSKRKRCRKITYGTWNEDHGGYFNTFNTVEAAVEAESFGKRVSVPVFELTAKFLGYYKRGVVIMKDGGK